MKLGIGTVQWGLPYGVSNANAVPSREDIVAMLAIAQKHDIHVLDTASQYGKSEERLGEALPSKHAFRIVTKTPALKTDRVTKEQAEFVADSFKASLDRLQQSSIEGLLIHHTPDLLQDQSGHLWKALRALKEKGLVRKIGVSVYTGEELNHVLSRVNPDLVQLPFNLLDQRLLQGGHLEKLKERGVEVHARSVFLQGLLLMEEHERPAFFRPWQPQLSRCHDLLKEAGLSPLQGALQFALQNPLIDCVLVGAASLKEFERVVEAAQAKQETKLDWSSVASQDETLLNPSLWKVA